MNDLDTLLREALGSHATDVTPAADLAARATRRSRQIRHRRIAAASATTAAVVGATGVAVASAIGHEGHGLSGRQGVVKVATAPTDTVGPSAGPATPSPTPGFASTCPDGQASKVRSTGAATASGDIQSNDNAETVTQAVMQSYLTDISNHTPISAYGVGTDSTTGRGVVWVQFQDQSVFELVISDSHVRWSSYKATLGPCAPIGS